MLGGWNLIVGNCTSLPIAKEEPQPAKEEYLKSRIGWKSNYDKMIENNNKQTNLAAKTTRTLRDQPAICHQDFLDRALCSMPPPPPPTWTETLPLVSLVIIEPILRRPTELIKIEF